MKLNQINKDNDISTKVFDKFFINVTWQRFF